ncbi:MAG: ABC transporter permease [Chloroflexi bacterium]|nr:ABC transporter permease [Chloroflexota bacterium]
MSDARQTTSQELEEFAQAQGLRIEERTTLSMLGKALVSFFTTKPLGAFGLTLVVVWSVIAIGTVGSGGGWLGLGRYDSQEVFKIANPNFVDDKMANELDGKSADISNAELRELLLAPEVYGDLAAESGVLDDMLEYVEGLIADGILLTHLETLDPAQIEIRDGTIADVDDLLATGTNTPLTTSSLQGPSGKHWFGTDRAGHDLFSRVTEGARLSLYIGFFATLIGVVAGTALGLVAGGLGGNIDLAISRLIDALLSFPPIVLLLLLRSVTEPSAIWVTLALSVLAVAPVQRIVRGAVIALREMPFVEAARTVGATNARIMLLHILPNIVAPLIVIFSITIGAFILAEAALSFLGLGTLDVSWGKMIADGRQFIVQSPWTSLFAGLALTSLVFGFNVLGDALRDVFDPRLRGSR